MYFLDKGALIIGFADKGPLIQRALYGGCPYPSDGATSKKSLNLSTVAAKPHVLRIELRPPLHTLLLVPSHQQEGNREYKGWRRGDRSLDDGGVMEA